jgi:hypothetical protein
MTIKRRSVSHSIQATFLAMSSNNTEKQAYLHAKLEELRTGTEDEAKHGALEDVFQIVIGYEDQKGRAFLGEMVAQGMVPAVLKAAKHPYHALFPHHGQIYHRVCSIFSILIVEGDSEKSAQSVCRQGGLDFVFTTMQSHATDKFLMISCLYVLLPLCTYLPKNDATEMKGRVLENVMRISELHKDSEKVYSPACDIIGHCISTPRTDMQLKMYNRVVHWVWHGVTKHKDHEDAQEIGRELLRHIVGPENALKMIDHAEFHHCEDADCSCAA